MGEYSCSAESCQVGLCWDLDPVAFQIFGIPIRYYGLIFLCVFLGGFALFRWQVRRGGGPEQDAADIFVPAILGVLIGARLGHVIFYEPGRALADPLWVFQIWKGGLASHGATAGLLFAIFVYARYPGWFPGSRCRRARQSPMEALDRFAWSSALGATLVRVGNFVNSEIVGRPTDGTWGFRFPRFDKVNESAGACATLRHPTQLYEVALGVTVIGILLLVDRLAGQEKRPRGLMISTFFAAYFTGRFFVEFFKAYQTLPTAFPLTMGQILSIPAATAGFLGIWWAFHRGIPAKWDLAPVEPPKRVVQPKRKRKR